MSKIFKKKKTIGIGTHINPDIDGISSMLIIKELIYNKYKINAECYLLSDFYLKSEMFCSKNFKIFDEKKNFDLFYVLDCGNIERLGYCVKTKKMINIDHHINNSMFGNTNIVIESAISTTEVIYKNLNKALITSQIANWIYAGLISDSGNFSWGNVNKKTFDMVKKLIDKGCDIQHVSSEISNHQSLENLKSWALAINKAKIKKNFIYSYISYDEFINFNSNSFGGVINKLKSVENIDFALLLIEEKIGQIKGSLRSCEKNVLPIAEMFKGGGHLKAAGFRTNCSLNEIINRITNVF